MKDSRHGVSIENRLISMLKDCKKWKPDTKQEAHDKRIVLNTLNYAITGKLRRKRQQVKSVE